MKHKITSDSGFTLLEMIVVIAVLAILGTATLTLLSASSNVFKHIHNDYNVENEARIALAYTTIKVRQNDFTYDVGATTVNSVKLVTEESKQYLNILNAQDKKAVWQITFENGNLTETFYKDGLSGSPSAPGVISEGLNNVIFNYDDIQKLLSLKIEYTVEGGESRTLEGKVYLRSE